MKTAEPNKYPLAYVPDPSRSSPSPLRPTSHLGRSRPPGTSGRDLLGSRPIPPFRWSRPLPPQAETTTPPLNLRGRW